MRDLAGRVMDSAERAPSYDGQFGPKVRALAAEAQARFSQQANRLEDHAEELDRVAGRFEAAELETIQGLAFLEVQCRSLLERIFGSSASVLGMAAVPGLLRHALLGEEPPPPDPDEEDDEKSLLDRLADQFREPEFFWDLISDKRVAAWMRTMKDSPIVTLVLPVLRGFGMDDVAGPLIRTFDTGPWVRPVGRILGEASAPPLFLIGWGLSVVPNQAENIRTGAPWNEHAADLAIDSGIFGGSEIAGWVTGLGGVAIGSTFGAPWLGLPAKLGADAFAGAWLDSQASSHNWRGWLSTEMGQAPHAVMLWLSSPAGDGSEYEIPPIPTPPSMHSATSTPTPPSLVPSLGLPPITSTPSPSASTGTIEPVVTPVPGYPGE